VWDITKYSRIEALCCEPSEIVPLLWKKHLLRYCVTVLRELLIKFNCSLLNICCNKYPSSIEPSSNSLFIIL
jgi:hypothetical protein